MRLEELLPDLLRRWWIVLISAAVAGAVGYLLVSDQPKEYQVSVTILAEAEPVDYWLDLYVKNSLPRYEPLILNHGFVQDALRQASLEIDAAQALDTLSVTDDRARNTLTVTVTDTDPVRTADIAAAIESSLVRLNEQQNETLAPIREGVSEGVEPRIALTFLEPAGPASETSVSGQRSTVLAATLLGAIVGAASVLALIYRDDSLRSTDDLDRFLARPLLAVVPDAGLVSER